MRQLDAINCGPTFLRIVANKYGRQPSAQKLLEATEIVKDGVNMLVIAQAAEQVRFKILGVQVQI